MAAAFTTSASLPPSTRDPNPWEPETAHADIDDNPEAYEDFPEVPNGHAANGDAYNYTNGNLAAPTTFPPRRSSLLPDPTRAPLPIALRASFLAFTLGLCIPATAYLHHISMPLWRLPFFAATLCTFHLLEFHTTAIYNPTSATISSFLLDNGRAYNVAHICAFLECFLHFGFFPWHRVLSWTVSPVYIAIGSLLLVVGQGVRTAAMAKAGSNFNHLVQSQKKDGHVLVIDGIYGHLRHPSYFGFFWWGLGGQLVLGNVVCLVGFAAVLWRFFRARIGKEEELLMAFFGEEYVRYKAKTRVGIPFIS